jgi:HK97 family phage portal protein
MFGWLLKRFGVVTKYDLNEYARRFMAGDDLPDTGDWAMSPESAMRIGTVLACVKVLSETIASLPCRIYKRLPKGGAEEAPDHPLYNLLYSRPNRRHTSFEFFEMMVAYITLRGNSICLKGRSNGKVVDLIPVHPSRVFLEEYEGTLIYRVTLNNGLQVPMISDDIFHVRGLSSGRSFVRGVNVGDYWGLSPIGASKDTFKLARMVQKYGISVFDSGGAKRVALKYPHGLSDTAYKRLKEDWEKLYKDNAKTAILEDGGDATTIGMNADEAQYLDTRKLNRTEICGIFRVPPHMVADLTRATFSNIAKQDLFFVKHTIRPWLKRLEAAITRDLLDDPRKYFVKFNVDALLRGDINERTNALKIQFMHGALTLNQWCHIENRNPLDSEVGDMHFVPNNLVPAERLLEKPQEEPKPADEPGAGGGTGGGQNEPKNYFEPIIADIAERLVNREVREAGKADWNGFYDQHRIYAFRAMKGLMASAQCDDEQKRAELADAIMAGLAEGCEIDIEARKKRITALLMAAVSRDHNENLMWSVRAAAALQYIEQQAAACDINGAGGSLQKERMLE